MFPLPGIHGVTHKKVLSFGKLYHWCMTFINHSIALIIVNNLYNTEVLASEDRSEVWQNMFLKFIAWTKPVGGNKDVNSYGMNRCWK